MLLRLLVLGPLLGYVSLCAHAGLGGLSSAVAGLLAGAGLAGLGLLTGLGVVGLVLAPVGVVDAVAEENLSARGGVGLECILVSIEADPGLAGLSQNQVVIAIDSDLHATPGALHPIGVAIDGEHDAAAEYAESVAVAAEDEAPVRVVDGLFGAVHCQWQ